LFVYVFIDILCCILAIVRHTNMSDNLAKAKWRDPLFQSLPELSDHSRCCPNKKASNGLQTVRPYHVILLLLLITPFTHDALYLILAVFPISALLLLSYRNQGVWHLKSLNLPIYYSAKSILCMSYKLLNLTL